MSSQEHTEQSKMGMLLIQVFKKLGLPCDLAVWITAFQLPEEMQRAEMALWMWDNKITDQEEIIKKAMSLSAILA